MLSASYSDFYKHIDEDCSVCHYHQRKLTELETVYRTCAVSTKIMRKKIVHVLFGGGK